MDMEIQHISMVPSAEKAPAAKSPLKLSAKVTYIGAASLLNTAIIPGVIGGGLVATANLIKGIWNIAILGKQILEKNILEKNNLAHIEYLPGDSGKSLDQLSLLMSGKEKEIEQTKIEIKANLHGFVGGILSAVPFCGILLSDAYLGEMHGNAVEFAVFKNEAKEMGKLVGAGFQGKITGAFYNKEIVKEIVDVQACNNECEEKLGNEKVLIKVDRGDDKKHELNCQVAFADPRNEKGDTMVLFHGNAMIGSELADEAKVYKDKGWNVVLVTMGGYPGCDEGVETNEATSIQDVNAVLKHLENNGVENIGVHGYSIGGSLAMHATKLSDKVNVVVLDKTFVDAPNSAANMLKNLHIPFLPSSMVRGVIRGGIPAGQLVYGVADKNGKPYFTDGCDNLEKVKSFKGDLICIGGTQDDFMGQEKVDDKYTTNFSQKLVDAYEGDNTHKKYHKVDQEHQPIGEEALEKLINKTLVLNLNVRRELDKIL